MPTGLETAAARVGRGRARVGVLRIDRGSVHRVPGRGLGIPARDGRTGPAGPDTGGPVSYTHLRAHENVLDLVCSLLLEKKNS